MASQLPVSPLAPKKFPKLPKIDGIGLATYATGSRYKGRDDLLLVRFAAGTSVAGVFTTSKAPSAAVDLSRANLVASKGRAGALVVNAGIANAFTGKAGDKAAQTTAAVAARAFGCAANQVFVASTGVIGTDLDPAPLVAAIDQLAADMPITGGDFGAAAGGASRRLCRSGRASLRRGRGGACRGRGRAADLGARGRALAFHWGHGAAEQLCQSGGACGLSRQRSAHGAARADFAAAASL